MGSLTPGDAKVAARSFPRRWRELLARADEDEELLRAGSPSVLELAGRAAARLAWTTDALHAVTRQDGVTLPEAAAAPPAPSRAQAALDRIGLEADALAEKIEAFETDAWRRSAVVGGRSRSALDLVEDALLAVAADLRAAERAYRQAREDRGD